MILYYNYLSGSFVWHQKHTLQSGLNRQKKYLTFPESLCLYRPGYRQFLKCCMQSSGSVQDCSYFFLHWSGPHEIHHQARGAAGFHIPGRQKYKHGKDRSKKPPDYEKDSSVNSVAGA